MEKANTDKEIKVGDNVLAYEHLFTLPPDIPKILFTKECL